tara:strand:- start:729 stop:1382 length:654 start_codon:yes stop_codon:yes gene_type:complete
VILNLNKPIGWTSFDVCKKIRSITKEKKVGHGGTLDPFAQGVLIVGTGKDTKELNAISNQNKTYEASILLGSLTDTLDIDGKITQKKNVPKFSEDLITNVLNSFIGEYLQTPPMYSAKKIKGKKLYEYARKNITIERAPIMVKIYSMSLKSFNNKNISFSVECSKGTYIRVLGKEIAEKLGTIGHLDGLVRTKVGKFCIRDSQSIETFMMSWKSFPQ